MNSPIKVMLSALFFSLQPFIPVSESFAHAGTGSDAAGDSIAYRFSTRPWPIRYFIFIDDAESMKRFSTRAAGLNSLTEKGIDDSTYLIFDEFFPPHKVFEYADGKIGVIHMTFSPSGALLTPQFNRIQFSAAKTEIGNLVLLKNGSGTRSNKPYHLASWWELPGKHIMSPAVCDAIASIRYNTDDPSKNGYIGGFGCREWSAQLQDDDRPYIDVTSYYNADYHIIDAFVGWSGFEHKPKPVIGKHWKTWICLHECPAGEEPGIISSIEAWTKKHGYPLPTPVRQPQFPNSMFQDIHEE